MAADSSKKKRPATRAARAAGGAADGDPEAPGQPPADLSAEKLVAWRRAVRRWWDGRADAPANLVGLALSGGGIRSATFSLGAIQALAKNGALAKIDILSTVSGGTYIGCFLRSLFLPASQRGIAPVAGAPDPRDIAEQAEFAQRALTSRADEKEIEGPRGWGRVRNPIWWLREHSRYLAPNGPTDYGFGLALVTRNWVGMLYIFFLALTGIMTTVIVAEAAVVEAATRFEWPRLFDWTWPLQPVPGGVLPVSPLFLLALVPAAFSAVAAVAYWMTQGMSPNEPSRKRQWWNLSRAVISVLVGAVIVWQLWRVFEASLPTGTRWVVWSGLALAVGGVMLAVGSALLTLPRRQLLTAELRRRLTRLLALSNWVVLVLAALALIDSLGAWLRHWYWNEWDPGIELGTAVVLPLFAFLIRKLPDWLADGQGRLGALLKRFMSPVGLVVGIVLYGVLAVLATAIVHAAVWSSDSWRSAPDLTTAALFALVVLILGLLAGSATGFINLSSLHGYYASRLTRAYLGASNVDRLSSAREGGGRIRENHRSDFIQPSIYGCADLAAPLHIINATLNETVDLQSQVVARDRKGDLLTVEPGGVRAGTGHELVPWEKLGNPGCAEQLSLGQWCAISGAAASTGMGRFTHLGLALAFAFANFRLGYWWWSPGVSSNRRELSFFVRQANRFTGTFIYLWNEMTARYSRGYTRKYLSDGGHYENSGAHALIRRGVPLILVADAGADPDYAFADLENLVRKARLDLGAEIGVLAGPARERFLAEIGCTDLSLFVDPAARPDWRAEFVDPASSAVALALRIDVAAEQDSPGSDREMTMVWIKPRRLSGMPHDLAGYAAENPAFPQQPTRDQFFDEEQWESYRKLGELSVERLLRACPGLLR